MSSMDAAERVEQKSQAHKGPHAYDLEENILEGDVGGEILAKDYHLIIRALKLPEKTKSGLAIPESTRNHIEFSMPFGRVVNVSPLAFTNADGKNRFPNGPRCELGDWVHYSHMERAPCPISNHNYFYVYDEKILGVVPFEILGRAVKDFGRYF